MNIFEDLFLTLLFGLKSEILHSGFNELVDKYSLLHLNVPVIASEMLRADAYEYRVYPK